MKIVAIVQVGNEVELIDRFIEYHFNVGIDAFVMCDICSADGTKEKLEKYTNSKNLLIRFVKEEEIYSEEGRINMQPFQTWMLEMACKHFNADWIIRLDVDEFLISNGNLFEILEKTSDNFVRLNRYNVAFSTNQIERLPPSDPNQIYKYFAVCKPLQLDPHKDDSLQDTPLVLGKIGPKVLARSHLIHGFITGGHFAKDYRREMIDAAASQNLLICHFWFTTYLRFKRKLSFIQAYQERIKREFGGSIAWQWSHWLEITKAGEKSIRAEFERQIFLPDTFERLLKEGIVCHVSDLFSEELNPVEEECLDQVEKSNLY